MYVVKQNKRRAADSYVGRRNGSLFLFIVLLFLLFLSLLMMAMELDQEVMIRAYNDPVLSSALVRGSILDRNGRYLAIQAPVFGFEIHISDSSAAECASFISRYTDENAISISSKIENGDDFIPITEIMSAEEMAEADNLIAAFSLSDDLTLTGRETRISLFPYIVGKTDDSMHGRSGIEKLFDNELSARPVLTDMVVYGKDIKLSIDMALQKEFEELMKGKEENAAIISDGNVLAFYGEPDDDILLSLVTEIGGEEFHAEFPYEAQEVSEGYSIYVSEPDTQIADAISQVIPVL